MINIQIMTLAVICTSAVLTDLWIGKIYNSLIVTGVLFGLLYQLFSNGVMGLILFLGGFMLPILILGCLYFFRMLGAGDIKLLCVIGGFLGPSNVWKVLVSAVFWGGVISAVVIFKRRLTWRRIQYFYDYMSHYASERTHRSYLDGTAVEARFCFSIPILMGLICYIGGAV